MQRWQRHRRAAPALIARLGTRLLPVAYGATTGGMATLIGTPPNALLAASMQDIYGVDIGFIQWMLLGVPVTAVTLPIVYLVLTRVMFRLDTRELPGMAALIDAERRSMGRLSRGERTVAIVFALGSAS